MAKKTRNILKGFFETGKKPTEGNYIDLIDSQFLLSGENTGSLLLKGEVNLNGSITSSKHYSGSSTSTITIGGALSAGAGTFTTVDTGQGANELYAMNQNVRTSDSVTFVNITATGNTILGNSAADTHTFTGDVTASRHISASSKIYADQFVGDGRLITGITSSLINVSSVTTMSTSSLMVSGTLYHPSASSTILLGIRTTGSIIPGGDGDFDLGSPTHYFKDLFVSTSTANHVKATTLTVGTITADNFTGNATTATSATSATNASNIAVTTNTTDETKFITFVDGNSGNQGVEVNNNFTYNSTRNQLSLGQITASSHISASGAITASRIFASGNISASGNIITPALTASGGISSSNIAVKEGNFKGTVYISGSRYSASAAHSSSLVSLVVTGSIIPKGAGEFNLGSPTNFFKDLFLSSGSLKFVKGTEVSEFSQDDVKKLREGKPIRAAAKSVAGAGDFASVDGLTNYIRPQAIYHETDDETVILLQTAGKLMYRTPGGDPFSVRSNGAGFAEVKIGSDTTKNDPNAHAGSFGRGTVVKIPGHISASNQNTPHHIGGTLKIYSGSYAIHLFGSGSAAQRGNISASGGGSITGFRNIIGVDTVGSTVSGYKTGSFGSVHTTGNISASGTITANKIETDNLVGHVGDANTGLKFAADTVTIEGNGVNIARFNTSNIELNKPIITDITASGNISASGVIISDKYQFSENTGNTYLEKTGTSGLTVKFGTSRFTGEITASGDISSSGTITGNDLRIKDQILRKNNNVIEAPSAGFSTTAITASIVSISGRIFTNLPAGTDNSVVVNSNGQLVTDEVQAAIFGSDPILTQELEASAENLTAGQATTATNVNAVANNSTNESNFITFIDGASGVQRIETDTALRYNPATNGITLGQISASSDISSSGTVQSTTGSFNHISIGNTQFNGNTFTTTGDIVLDTNTDIQLDAAGGNIEFKDAGTLQLTLDMDGTAGAQVVKLEVSGDDLIFKSQGGTNLMTLKHEGQTEIHGNITASGNISASGTIEADSFNSDGKNAIGNTGAAIVVGNQADFPVKIGRGGTTNIELRGPVTASNISASGNLILDGNITASSDISASGTITAASYVGLPSGIISSSTQLPSGTISSSAQLPSGIISSSTQLPSGIISGSTNIFAAITSSGNISASGTITGLSGSFSELSGNSPLVINSETTFIKAITASSHVSASGNITATGNLDIDGNTTLNGTAKIVGSLTASKHISGTLAGNILGFNSGSFAYLTTTGNISASGTVFADNFQSAGGDVAGISFTDNLNLTGDLTASGNISSSKTVTAEHFFSSDDAVITDLLTVGHITSTGNSILGNAASDTHTITGDITASRHIKGTNGNISNFKSGSFTGEVFGRGISSSTFIHAATNLDVIGNTILGNTTTDTHTITGDVTASRHISGTIAGDILGFNSGSFANLHATSNISASGVITGLTSSFNIIKSNHISGTLKIDSFTNFTKAITASSHISGTLAGNVTGFNSGSFAYLTTTGDISASGNIISKGFINSEGSTTLGDSITDTHTITGKISLTGPITASSHISSSTGISNILNFKSGSFTGEISASGTSKFGAITSSNNITIKGAQSESRELQLIASVPSHVAVIRQLDLAYTSSITASGLDYSLDIRNKSGENTAHLILGTKNIERLRIGATGAITASHHISTSMDLLANNSTFAGGVTAGGNISGSIISASGGIHTFGTITTLGKLVAGSSISGSHISASGNLTSNGFLKVGKSITASSHISGTLAGNVTGFNSGSFAYLTTTGDISSSAGTITALSASFDSLNVSSFGQITASGIISTSKAVIGLSGSFSNLSVSSFGEITSSGNISSSKKVIALSGSFSEINGNSPLTVNAATTFTSPITSSAIISSSVNIISPNINSLTSATASYALLSQTGSFATTSSLNAFTASALTTGSNTFSGNQTIAGSVLVTGSLTVSGSGTLSNIGPFSQTGISTFTGSIIVSSSGKTNVNVLGEITASSHISSSGNVNAGLLGTGSFAHVKVDTIDEFTNAGVGITIKPTISASSDLKVDGNTILGNAAGDTHTITGDVTASRHISGTLAGNILGFNSGSFANLHATSNISASGTITGLTGSFSNLNVSSFGQITSSGIISSSNTFIGLSGSFETLNSPIASNLLTINAKTSFVHPVTASSHISGANGNILGFKSGSFTGEVSAAGISSSTFIHAATNLDVNGNTILGDAAGDTHTITGDVTASRHISGTLAGDILGFRSGSFNSLHIRNANDLSGSQGNINNFNSASLAYLTTTGDISSSGNLFNTGNIQVDGNTTLGNAATDTHLVTGKISLTGPITASSHISGANGNILGFKSGSFTGEVSAVGISSSNWLYAAGTLDVDGSTILGNQTSSDTHTVVGKSLTISAPITASTAKTHISGASGNILGFNSGSFKYLNTTVGDISSSANINAGLLGTGSFANIALRQTGEISGSGGDIFNFRSASFTSVNIGSAGELSGSQGDIYNFKSGSFAYLKTSGNISASSISASGLIKGLSGSFSNLNVSSFGQITSSGIISTSAAFVGLSGSFETLNSPIASNLLTVNTKTSFVHPVTASSHISGANGNILGFKSGSFTGEISGRGISSSTYVHVSSDLDVNGNTALGNAASDTHLITGDITASRHISASGNIIASGFVSASSINISTTTAATADAAHYSVNGSRVEVRNQLQEGLENGTFAKFELRNTSINAGSIVLGSFTGNHSDTNMSGSIITAATIGNSTASIFIHNETGGNIANDTPFTASFIVM